tara:strand:+ start:279 stop:1190 length:912 start_codon:yes stop_codon:yes gene_type:complete
MRKFWGGWLLLLIFAQPLFAQLVFVPEKLNKSKANVLIVLHGCMQSAETMAAGTGFDTLARKHNFVVIYPQVPEGSNMVDCWNWFYASNQKRESGQLEEIMTSVESKIQDLDLKDPKLFVAGLSAGGIMASSLLACFPEKFQAGAIHSGTSYGLAQNILSGDYVLRRGPPAMLPWRFCNPKDFKGSLLAIHGDADEKVHPIHAEFLIEDFTGLADPLKRTGSKKEGTAMSTFEYTSKKDFRIARVHLVHGMGHAWFGSRPAGHCEDQLKSKGFSDVRLPFFESKGPHSSELMMHFFLESLKRH